MEEYDIDPQLLAEFMDESSESLQTVGQMLIGLEENPDDLDTVNAIFRPVHSLKGTSAFFGLLHIKDLAHIMENLLDDIRNQKRAATKKVIDVLLEGLDMLNHIIGRIQAGEEEIGDEGPFNEVIARLESIYASTDVSEGIIKTLLEKLNGLRGFLPEDQIVFLDEALVLIGTLWAEAEGEFVETIESAEEGSAPVKIIKEILKDAIDDVLPEEQSRAVLGALQDLQNQVGTPAGTQLVTDAIEAVEGFTKTVGFDGLLRELVLEKLDQITVEEKSVSTQASEPVQTEEEPAAAEETATKQPAKRGGDRRQSDRRDKAEADKTMRVSEKNIDSFLSYVGELVVVEEMFKFLQKSLVSSSSDRKITGDFKRVIETFGTLSDSLRKSILDIRTVPIQNILQKAPKIIRDVAESSGKKAEVKIEGGNVKIDKSYLDLLDAPLTHMVRNAIDHGIEPAQDRLAAGKSEKGNIVIVAKENKNDIELMVAEDGKGIDHDAIYHKAVDMGIVASGQVLEPDKIVDFIFASGVSTAKEITDVSGRGVGMDVVKRNIEAAGGKITVDSKKDHGTTFRIILPKSVSTQIMQGFLVKAGKEIYVIPMELVGESFVPNSSDINTVSGKGEMVSRRGGLFPMLRLARILDAHPEEAMPIQEASSCGSISYSSIPKPLFYYSPFRF